MIILVRNDPQSELSTTVMEMPSSSTNYDDDYDDESSTDTKGLELLGRSAKRKAVAYILYIAAAASKRAFSSHHGILLYHHRVDRKIPFIDDGSIKVLLFGKVREHSTILRSHHLPP